MKKKLAPSLKFKFIIDDDKYDFNFSIEKTKTKSDIITIINNGKQKRRIIKSLF